MALAGARIAIRAPHVILWQTNGHLKVLFSIFTFICSPFHSLILGLKEFWIELKLQHDPESEDLIHQLDEIHYHLCIHTKLELGLETILQSCLQVILLLFAISETRTTEGLSEIFRPENETILTFLTLSTLWSFASNVLSHIKSLSSMRRRFPGISKFVVALYSFFSITTRVMAIVIFFSPSLGLFNLLQHWKGEQIQWHPFLIDNIISNKTVTFEGLLPIHVESIFKSDSLSYESFTKTSDEDVKDIDLLKCFQNSSDPMNKKLCLSDKFFTIDGTIQFGNSSKKIWSQIDHSRHYINRTVALPDYTIYTGLNLKTFFFIFIAISVLQVIIIYLVKSIFANGFQKFNLLEKFIHCLESSHIPYNSEEWDATKGNAVAHIKRMKKNQLEGILLILVNLVFKLGMVCPLYFLGK